MDTKKRLAIVGKFVAVAVLIVTVGLTWDAYNWYEDSRATSDATKQLSGDIKTTADYGIITITTTGSVELPTYGRNVRAVPLVRVAWEEYCDGRFVRRMNINASTDKPKRTEIQGFEKISWKLVPGQGVERVPFAYFMYYGDSPPSNWYALALSKGS